MDIRRARLSLLAATGLASAILAFEVPFGEIAHQNDELVTVTGQLARVRSLDQQLASEVSSLRQSSTIAAMAHGEYGLVRPGQQAYALLDSGGASHGAVPSLVQHRIVQSDLVVPSVDALAQPVARSSSGSLWSRVVGHLAFWRWAF